MSPTATVDITFGDDGAVDIGRPKPCPFKHDPGAVEHYSPRVLEDDRGDIFVKCGTCFARGPEADTEAMAVRAWNERATE